MEKILLILSILFLHYPTDLIKDTAQKFKRMEYYNKVVDPNKYNPEYIMPVFILTATISFILPIFPIKELFNLGSILSFLINIALAIFVMSFLTSFIIPMDKINDNQSLKRKSFIYITLGLISYALTFII